MISNSTLIIGLNIMDKIVKIELIKKVLLFIFVLIATFSLFMFLGGYFISGMSSILTSRIYFILMFVMIISAIITKYLGDIVIVALDRNR
jgi:hypothetical protein